MVLRRVRQLGIVLVCMCFVVSNIFQTSYARFPHVYAQSASERTNLVAVLVDTAIYDAISGDLSRYANTYVPAQAPGTQLVIVPLDPAGFESPDVYRILENLYFDGKKSDSSNLVGVMVFGDIPLPPIEFGEEQFLSVHPYTDFEGPPMFEFDDARGLRVSTSEVFSQPEIRHSVIPGQDVELFAKFFEKVRKYFASPTEYAEPKIRYEDYEMMQDSFNEEQLDEYINTLLFADDRAFSRSNRTMTDVLNKEYGEDILGEIEKVQGLYTQYVNEPVPDGVSHPEVEEATAKINAGVQEIIDHFDVDEIKSALSEIPGYQGDGPFQLTQAASDSPIATLVNNVQLQNSFRSAFSVYGDEYLIDIEDNLAAGGRYPLTEVDNAVDLMQLKDAVATDYLKRKNIQLEQALDKIIQDEQYMLKYPVPTWYEHWIAGAVGNECVPDASGPIGERGNGGGFGVDQGGAKMLSERYENFYYGKYAGDLQQYDEMHVYRGGWSNQAAGELMSGPIPAGILEDVGANYENASFGASFGGFAQQARQMRGTDMSTENSGLEAELYDQTKCSDDQSYQDRAKVYRGGGSPFTIDQERYSADPTDIQFDPAYYDEGYMRHPTTNRMIGGPQLDAKGTTYMTSQEYSPGQLYRTAHETFSKPQRVDRLSKGEYLDNADRGTLPLLVGQRRSTLHCEERKSLPFEFLDFFRVWYEELPEPDTKKVINVDRHHIHEVGGAVNQFLPAKGADHNLDNKGLRETNWFPWLPEMNVSDGSELLSDQDGDLVPDVRDRDLDGDGHDDEDDADIDGDGILNTDDPDIDNDGIPNRGDQNADGDEMLKEFEGDDDADGLKSASLRTAGELNKNQESVGDDDANGCKCGGSGSCARCNKQSLEELTDPDYQEDPNDPNNKPIPTLDNPFSYKVKTHDGSLVTLGSLFSADAKYMVIDLADSDCVYCTDLAREINTDLELQEKLSGTCDYMAVVPGNNLDEWMPKVQNQQAFVGPRSVEMSEGGIWFMENLFTGGESAVGLPHVFVVDRAGNVVTRAQGGLPPSIDTLCEPTRSDQAMHTPQPKLFSNASLRQRVRGGIATLLSFFGPDVYAQSPSSSPSRGISPGRPYNYNVREVDCPVARGGQGTYQDWYYRDYHIIDTVTQNKNPTNHDLNRSETTTFERATDDPRFTTFHGIGGDLVQMNYADLYNVDVYGGGQLLDEAQIEANIKTYLLAKATRYNNLLQDQLAAAPGYYAKSASAFDFLATVHSSATPNRTYNLIPQTYFVDVLGEEEIQRIAHSLYYLSYAREQRPSGSSVAAYIENARETIDLDRKIEYVSELYMLSRPGLPEDAPDDVIRLPRYIDPNPNREERKAYEAAYINSNAYDAMPLKGNEQAYEDEPAASRSADPDVGSSNPDRDKATALAAQDDQECDVPPEGAVPLLKRPKAFMCWLEKTIEKPVEFELEVSVDLGSVQDISNIGRVMEDWYNEAKNDIVDDATDAYEDLRGTVEDIIDIPDDVSGDDVDADAGSSSRRGENAWFPRVYAQEQIEPVDSVSSLYEEELDARLERDLSSIESIRVITPTTSFMPGGIYPLILEATDESGNKIPFADDIVTIELEGAVFKGGATTKEVTRFLDEVHMIRVDQTGSGTGGDLVRVRVVENELGEASTRELAAPSFQITDASLDIQTPASYTLPSKEDGFWITNVEGRRVVAVDRLPRVQISAVGAGDDFVVPFGVEGGSGIVQPGTLDSQGRFQPTSQFMMQGETAEVYLLPTGTAAQTSLTFISPVHTQDISLDIRPSGAEQLDISFIGSPQPGEEIQGSVEVYDSRGNPFTDEVEIELDPTGERTLSDDDARVIAKNGSVAFSGVVSPSGGGCGCGAKARRSGGSIDGASDADGTDADALFVTSSAETQTEKILRPHNRQPDGVQDINAMYVSLYGNARGDRDHVLKLLKNTKTLTVTTTWKPPVSPEKSDLTSEFLLDGTRNDELEIFKELVFEGPESVYLELGYDGGEGRVYLGTSESLGLSVRSDENEEGPPPPVIFSTKNGAFQERNQLKMSDTFVLLDTEYGFVQEQVRIVPSDTTGNEWTVTYKNEPVATFQFVLQGGAQLDADITSQNYIIDAESADAVTFVYHEAPAAAGTSVAYDSLRNAADSKEQIGFRHNFSALTNFAQGQLVGPATKGFGDITMLNSGDPFLKRIDENEVVTHTDYDAGVGQQLYVTEQNILDVKTMDLDGDAKEDMIIAQEDGGIRILKNYGGEESLTDIGEFMTISDGVKSIYPGDADGDGDDDLIVHTRADRLRVYKNNNGVMEIDGRPVCLTVPNGERSSVGQVAQLHVGDIDGDGVVDILTLTETALKLFYGGGNNYISTDPNECDDEALSRNKINVLKTMEITAGVPFSDASLIHGPTTFFPPEDEDPKPIDTFDYLGEELSPGEQNITSRSQARQYVEQTKMLAIDRLHSTDLDDIINEGKGQAITYLSEAPVHMRPLEYKDDTTYAYMLAQDTQKSATMPNKVSKVLIDHNGPPVMKGDMLTVQVSISGPGPFEYLEKIDLPVLIFRDEYGEIQGFENGVGGDLNRHIADGYEFMITGGQPGTISYDVQRNGTANARFEVESDLENRFESNGSRTADAGGATTLLASMKDALIGSVNAAEGDPKTVRLYSTDACYKSLWEFDGREVMKRLTQSYDTMKEKANGFFEDQRTQAETDVASPDTAMMKKLMGIDEVDFNMTQMKQIRGALHNAPTIELESEYIEGFNDFLIESADTMCKGLKIGETNCGGLPLPFNMAFLSPGTYNVFGCQLAPDKGLPVLAFPTVPLPMPPVPMRPISPSKAGGYFGGESAISQFRTYLSPTVTNQMGIAVCRGPYAAGMNIPSPVGEIAGNCVVVSAPLGGTCDDGGTAYTAGDGSMRQKHESTLSKEAYDLSKVGVCDPSRQERSGIFSSLHNGRIAIEGTAKSVVSSVIGSVPNYLGKVGGVLGDLGDALPGTAGGITTDLISFDKYTLQGGENIDLEIQGGNVKGVMACVVRKRVDNQIRYVSNNLLSMQLTVIMPDLSELGAGLDQLMHSGGTPTLRNSHERYDQTLTKAENAGLDEVYTEPDEQYNQMKLPKSLENTIKDQYPNPFSRLAQLLDSTPLINVKERKVRVQVPLLYNVDKRRIDAERNARLRRNKLIIESRKSLDVTSDAKEEIIREMERAEMDVRRNLETLKLYVQFGEQLYDHTHAVDQYYTEVIDFADSALSQVSGWMQTNANRYAQYVDTIILMIGIAETRQPLIEISTKRKTKCAKCSVDNYDYYSCKLSMLCPNIGVLPLPPFKIPDVFIDLSQIRLGVDVMLPKFVFVPEKINYPRLPDLPDPKNVELNLDITMPQIPSLIGPPPLPQVPTLDIDLDLHLPNLPPPPKIPNIFPTIKVMLTGVDFVGTIFCILKGGVGIVAEQSVKSRIEQLTQRTRNVDPFDTIQVTLPDHPLEGVDFEVSAMVDLKLSFDALYDFADAVADNVNEFTSDQIDQKTEGLRNVERIVNQARDSIDVPVEGNIDIGYIPDTYESFPRPDPTPQQEAVYATLRPGGEYADVKSRLIEELNYLLGRTDMDEYHAYTKKVKTLVTTDPQVRPMYSEIDRVQREFTDFVGTYRDELTDIQSTMEREYDAFLDSYVKVPVLASNEIDISGNDDIYDEGVLVKQFNATLFDANPQIVRLLQTQEHPAISWLNLHTPMLEGYKNALEKYTKTDLNMSPVVFDASRSYISTLWGRLFGGESRRAQETEPQETEPKDEGSDSIQPETVVPAPDTQSDGLATANFRTQSDPAPTTTTVENLADRTGLDMVDMTDYIDGFYVEGKDQKYHNVIAERETTDRIEKDNTYLLKDLNGDKKTDIIHRDSNVIRAKYAVQNDIYPGGGGGSAITIGPRSSVEELEEAAASDEGYINGLKMRDEERVRFDAKREGNNFESMGFSRENDEEDGYVVSLTHKADVHNDMDGEVNASSTGSKITYALVLPQGVGTEGLSLEIPHELEKKPIQDYLDDGTITMVTEFDGRVNYINTFLENLPKERYYTKVAPVTLIKQAGGGRGLGSFFGGGGDDRYLKRSGPRSTQVLAGAQKWGDDQAPQLKLELIRKITGEPISQGIKLEGYVQTDYILSGEWIDQGAVLENTIMYDGELVYLEDDEKIYLDLTDKGYDVPTVEKFEFSARDQAGNQPVVDVTLTVLAPTIEITEVTESGVGYDVHTELSDTIDKGIVSFFVDRFGRRQKLDPFQFGVVPTDPKVTGGVYVTSEDIGFYTPGGAQITSLIKKTGEIKKKPEIELHVDFAAMTPEVHLIERENMSQNPLFRIGLVSDRLESLEVLNGNYEKVEIKDGLLRGEYRGGYCIQKKGGECHAYIDENGNMSIPRPWNSEYEGGYDFDSDDQHVIYTIYTAIGDPVFRIEFEARDVR